ncbi:MAG: hypothetical protein P1U44_14595 [Vicingaceae bacterium]|nr:hypothetical protein [Vicingaceae bacterium]
MNKIVISTCLLFLFGCTNAENQATKKETVKIGEKDKECISKKSTHKYGGWYCPDNLYGFPAVNLKDWASVPVLENKLPTQEEARSEKSLIYIDKVKYPDAKAMDIKLPKLAKFYNYNSKKYEVIIVIQAVEIEGDTVLGFRYLNGGNGSSLYHKVTFIDEQEVASLAEARFVDIEISINASEDSVWNVMTSSNYTDELVSVFDSPKSLFNDWKTQSGLNYNYTDKKYLTADYGDKLFGNWYIQNDYLIKDNPYVEKFFIHKDNITNETILKIVCGPYINDFSYQKIVLQNWVNKVKVLSEK